MNRHIRAAAIGLSALMLGCMDDAPPTQELELGPECVGTEPGRACLKLSFTVSGSARKRAPGDLIGRLAWAVYRGGDVGIFGPGNNKPVYEGELPHVDMSASDARVEAVLPNIVAGSYHVLAQFDDDENGKVDSGEPVTFPKDAFDIPADRLKLADIELDYNY